MLQSRATDETGQVQPARSHLIGKRGVNFTYHYNAITTWQVDAKGGVKLAA